MVGLNKKTHHTKNLQKYKPEHRAERASKKRKAKPGMVALRKIKKYQKTDRLLIPKENFRRLILEISQDLAQDNIRFQKDVILLIQLWIEEYIVGICEDANLVAIHAKRETVYPEDIKLIRKIRKEIV